MIGSKRGEFLELAGALGAAFTLGCQRTAPLRWTPRPDRFPHCVASGDPDEPSVLLWTRRPLVDGDVARRLTVEVADDAVFTRVVASADAVVSADSDWTVRVLAPARVYWHRFIDDRGHGSGIGRTITAPAPGDPRPVQFAFVRRAGRRDEPRRGLGRSLISAPPRYLD